MSLMILYLSLTLVVYILSKKLYRRTQHMLCSPLIICPIVLLLVAVILLLTKEIGVSLFGVCGIKLSTYCPCFRSILIIAYSIGLFISSLYFRKRIP